MDSRSALLGALALMVLAAGCAQSPGTANLRDTPYTVDVGYEVVDGCISSIKVDPMVLPIECSDHLLWCGGDAAGPPQVTWDIIDQLGDEMWKNYNWWAIQKPTTSHHERDHFAARLEIVDEVPNDASGNRPGFVGDGKLTWTYSVWARPKDGWMCEEVEEDPQVVFNGGGRPGLIPPDKLPIVGAGIAALVALLVVVAIWRRRASGRP